MATTTNYSWSTPDDTALVKDGAAAIRSLGTAIDTTVFNNAGAAIAKTIVDAKGDLIAGTASDTVSRLAVGSNGTVLIADSSTATGLKWDTPPGGKVLQVVQATTSTATTISSTTYADTTLTATITPTSATSKVLVMFSQVSSTSRNDIEAGSGIRLLRGATAVYEPATGGFETQYIYGTGIGSSGTNIKGIVSASYLDSPATTSATTYKTQSRTQNSTNSPSVTLNSGISTMILMEIGA